MKKLKFRTQQSLYIGDLFLALFGVCLTEILIMILSDFGLEWLYGLLAAMALFGIPAIMVLCVCFIGRAYYIVGETSLKKYKLKKQVLNVPISDILEIQIVKTSFCMKLLTPLGFIFGGFFCDMIAIKYSNDNEEFDFKESRAGLGTKIIKNEDGSSVKYNVDLLPCKKAKQLALLLNCPIKMVREFDFY